MGGRHGGLERHHQVRPFEEIPDPAVPGSLDGDHTLSRAGQPGTPDFIQAAGDAQYYLGLARHMGGEFFRTAPNLKLVQLLSAGYDNVDLAAAAPCAPA